MTVTAGAEVKAAGPGFPEFIALMAMMFSLVALSIDSMLPALPAIGGALAVADPNDNQLVISMLFLGLAGGQILFGTLSDAVGRKPAIYAGFVIFLGGSLLCIFAADYPVMLAGRVLQGVGAAAPRIVTVALIRDRHAGREMARVMSFALLVFIMVPAVAPGVGQLIMAAAGWRAIFVFLFVFGAAAFAWFALRQPETLAPELRTEYSLRRIARGITEAVTQRAAFGYTVALGMVFGAFLGYLNTAQQIFQQLYELGALFPLYFAVLALAIGAASWVNARLVMRFGMKFLSLRAALALSALSLAFLAALTVTGGKPPLWLLMTWCLSTFFCVGILFGNLNTLAMEPLGRIAGVGAAVVGSLATFIAVPLGTFIGQSYNNTVTPLAAGFAALGVLIVTVMRVTEGGGGGSAGA